MIDDDDANSVEKLLMPTSDAPGATPRTRIVQPAGSGWLALTTFDRS
jgi:hypothetical protein